jgi:hypothetical protein
LQYCDINLDEYIRGLRPPCLALYSYAEAKGNDDLPVVVCGIMQQVLNGLIFIHEKGQVHRDLKPMNGTTPTLLDISLDMVLGGTLLTA